MKTPIVIGDTPQSMDLGLLIDGKHYRASDIKALERMNERLVAFFEWGQHQVQKTGLHTNNAALRVFVEAKTENLPLDQYNAEVGFKAIQTLVDHIKSGKVGRVLVDPEVVGTHVIESYLADLKEPN